MCPFLVSFIKRFCISGVQLSTKKHWTGTLEAKNKTFY